MRARTLKPAFFANEKLGAIPPLARLLFAGLWCVADRAGRLEDRPARLKVQLLPYDQQADIDALLSDLENAGFVLRYSVDGAGYIQICNFQKHQHFHRDEKESGLPPPPDFMPGQHGANTVPASCQHGAHTVPAPEQHHANTPIISNLESCIPSSTGDESPAPQTLKPVPAEDPSPRAVIFREGLPVLVRAGQKESSARALLGKLAKEFGEEAVSHGVVLAGFQTALEPVSWLRATLQARAKETTFTPEALALIEQLRLNGQHDRTRYVNPDASWDYAAMAAGG